MRKLILTRGAPGTGKSTVLARAGLAPYALSMDQLRLLLAGPQLLANGQIGIDQSQNERVAMRFRELVEDRMARGELLAVDNTMPAQRDFNGWAELAERYRYEIIVLDFSGVSLEQAQAQNRLRDAHKQVPEAAIERIHGQCQGPLDPRGHRVIAWTGSTESMAQALNDAVAVPIEDFTGTYDRIVHIGDLQGCLSVLVGPGGPLEHGFDPRTLYVFVGDLVDRGIENGALVRWFHANVLPRANTRLLWGNHEDHLERFGRGLEPVSPEFRERTLPQLLEAGVTPQMALDICAKAQEVLPYRFHDHQVLVTHAGLATVPERLEAISLHQYARGTGHWSDPVDAQFTRLAPEPWVQVHGHRNHGAEAILATPRSINLEDAVEFGGHLRTATLTSNGWTAQAYRNTVFEPARRRRRSQATSSKDTTPTMTSPLPLSLDTPAPWMQRPSETRMSDAALAAMLAHPDVRARTSQRAPHVLALNFSKQVFFKASWDDVLVKARGLFVNAQTQEIVARGYEKFFNVGERPETTLEALDTSLEWPVAAYVKENGYLGNLGYDAETNDLFIASKSTPDGDFADWFREIFEATVPEGQRERIRRWLRDNEASMVFEVIDPVRDPHMIDYPAPKLVLLDVFHRSTTPEKLPFDHLQALGKALGLEVKQRALEFKNPAMFKGWYAKAHADLQWRYRGQDIEGLVLEGRNLAQTKVKLAHYAFWKRMRAAKDRLASLTESLNALRTPAYQDLEQREAEQRELLEERKRQLKALTPHTPEWEAQRQQVRDAVEALGIVRDQRSAMANIEAIERDLQALRRRDPHPLTQAFLDWTQTQDPSWLKASSILQVRQRFLEEVPQDPVAWATPWHAFGSEEAEADPDQAPRKPEARSKQRGP